MLDEVGQPRLVVGSYEGTRSLPLCLAAHDGHVTLQTRLGLVRRTAHIFVVKRASDRGPDPSCPEAERFLTQTDRFLSSPQRVDVGIVDPASMVPI